ncbi:MAG: glycosyltransferase family 4 protein [Bdellovibrionaceae bacterium]|nr:glycosyltransferase family 4 protein [Pseudobdellovibrionaceae bacterium]
MAKKSSLPESLNICLVSNRFQILSRSTDSGFLWPIARGLSKQGHKVTVISTRSPIGKPEVIRDGVRTYYLQESGSIYKNLRFEEAALQKFTELHKQEPFHIVHSLDNSGRRIARNKEHFKVAVAYDAEATQMSQLFSILGMSQETLGSLLTTAVAVTYKFLTTFFGTDRKLLKSADGVFVNNPQQRIILERYYLYPDFNIYTVPYGMELGDLSPKEESYEYRKKWNLSSNAHVVVTISDMTEIRELQNLMRSFEKVAVKKPNAYLIVVGNGPYFKQIEFEMLNLALGNRVILPGALTSRDLIEFILMADVYVDMSSRSTGFEASLIEAMAQKKVIIGSEVSPIANVVEDGVDGFLLRPADIESLASLLIEIFSGTLPAEEIGDRARQKVIDLFDTQKMIRTVLDAYRKILLNTGMY